MRFNVGDRVRHFTCDHPVYGTTGTVVAVIPHNTGNDWFTLYRVNRDDGRTVEAYPGLGMLNIASLLPSQQ